MLKTITTTVILLLLFLLIGCGGSTSTVTPPISIATPTPNIVYITSAGATSILSDNTKFIFGANSVSSPLSVKCDVISSSAMNPPADSNFNCKTYCILVTSGDPNAYKINTATITFSIENTTDFYIYASTDYGTTWTEQATNKNIGTISTLVKNLNTYFIYGKKKPVTPAPTSTPNLTPVPTATPTVYNPTVYITSTGDKYHIWGCQYLYDSAIAILLLEAKQKGYTPCSVCNPPKSK